MTTTTPYVLDRLEGWLTDTQDATNYDVTGAQLLKFIGRAEVKVTSYLRYEDTDDLPTSNDLINDAVADWAAGLAWLWKYTADTPSVDVSQEYGERLIQDAKETLNPLVVGTPGDGTSTSGKGGRETGILAFAVKYDQDVNKRDYNSALLSTDPDTDDED